MEVIPRLPADLTFLSQVLYEGLLQYYRYGSLHEALKNTYDALPENAKLYITGNDLTIVNKQGKLKRKGFPEQLLMYLDPIKFNETTVLQMAKQKTNYTNLMDPNFVNSLLDNENIRKLNIVPEDLFIEFKGSEMIIGGKKEITAPQIAKIDRYTGLSSLEAHSTSKQITIFMSANVALLFLVGLYSSFVANVYSQDTQYYYFLFYYPEEEIELLLRSDSRLIDVYFIVKHTVREELESLLKYTTFNELLLLELTINTRIRDLLSRENLDKISLNLLKVAKEGQTYKIYEHTPVTLLKYPYFLTNLSNYIRDPNKFLGTLSNILAPGEILLDALRNNWVESDNVLSALRNLYRFIFLSDAQGFFEFINGLNKAYLKLRGAASKKDAWRLSKYSRIISLFTYI